MTVAEKNIRELISDNEVILDEIKRGEDGSADVFSGWSEQLRIVFEGNDFSVSSSQRTGNYGVRCIRGGRLGFVTSNSNSLESLRSVAREVQSICKLSTASEFNMIAPKPQSSGHFESIDLKLQGLTPAELGDFADKVVQTALSDKRVVIDRAEISWNHSYWALTSSNGFSQSAASTTCSWFVMGMAKQNDEVTSFDYDGGTVHKYSEMDSEILKTIAAFKDSVVGSLGPRRLTTYKGLVVLHPQAVMDLIVDFVETNCNALRHQDGMSSWKGKLGEQVAHPCLVIQEDPLNSSRIEGWMPFDREGWPTHFHTLIENGRLNFLGHNCFTAKRGGVEPTGNAAGGSRSLPGIGFSNLSVSAAAGTKDSLSDTEILARAHNALLIKRFSGNSDATSGQFSGVAKNSHYIENGQMSYPVHEVMIAGNLFDLLKNVVAIGKHPHRVHGGGAGSLHSGRRSECDFRMTVKSWSVILALEILTVFLVLLLFKSLDKQIAGLVAGFLFGILGLIIGIQLLRKRTIKSFTFWWLFVYMFYSVVPMLLNRLDSWGVDFSNVQIWGMTGPEFHKVSERIYGILIVATLLDLSMCWYSNRKRSRVL